MREDLASIAAELARRLDAACAVLSLDAARFGAGIVGSPGAPQAALEALSRAGSPMDVPAEGCITTDFDASPAHASVAAGLRDAGFAMSVRVPLSAAVGVIGAAELYWGDAHELSEIGRVKLSLLTEQAAMNVVTMRLFGLVERAKREWEVTFDAIRDGISVHDRDCRIRRANWGLGIMLGTTPSMLVGKTCHEAIFGRPAPCTHCPLVPHGAAKPFKARESEDVIEGRAVHVSMYPLVGEDGTLSGVVNIVRDISERKEEEREFRRMHEELVRAHGTLQGSVEQLTAAQAQLVQSEKMAAVGQLISGVAHELNNPLTGIIGYSQLLGGGEDSAVVAPEKLTRYVRNMGREAVRCQKIVQNLLTFARRNEPEKRPTDLNDVIRRTVELRAYDLRVHDVALDLDLSDALPQTMADQHQLQQVVLNMVQNAYQSIRAGRGRGRIGITTYSAEKPSATPTPEHSAGQWLVLLIEDDGPGFTDDVKARMFDPFFTTKEVGQGTGLGLSICYGIVREHHGYVSAERVEGGGARFRVELPVVAPAERRRPARAESAVVAPAPAGRRILVVDDEATICDMVRDILVLDGHVVETARNGQAGLLALESTAYDCVLVDLKMPEVDGATLHERLKAKDPEAARRMIFMTGDMLSDGSRQFLEAAGNAYLAKPFSIQDLRARVAAILAE